MYKYRVNEINFKEGNKIETKNLTIFIGPNNSGKSQILKDILKYSTTEKRDGVILEDLKYDWPNDLDEILASYKIKPTVDHSGNHYFRTFNSSLSGTKNLHIGEGWRENIARWLSEKNVHSEKQFSNHFGSFLVSFLSTEDRLKNILQSNVSRNDQVDNLLQAVYNEGLDIENNLRKIVQELFDLDIKLDYSSLINICFRIADNFSDVPTDLREAKKVLEQHRKLDDQGDGIKSFVSTFLSLHVGEKPVLLLDEPEAFLHPPQALRLGELIAEQANEERQIFVSTHSSDLLRGILNKRQDIDLIRITRQNDKNTISHLDPEEVKRIATDPLLNSIRILEGLFYKGVVITEADSDSIFYQRISRQLFDNDDIHYTHAHNKQTVTKVSQPYSKLGLTHCVVVDFDAIRVWPEFKRLLNQKGLNQEKIEEIQGLRKSIVDEIESQTPGEILDALKTDIGNLSVEITNLEDDEEPDAILVKARRELKKIREDNSPWTKYKKEGLNQLSKANQDKFNQISSICKSHGIFLVPVGELESWLVDQGLPKSSNKAKWIVNALERIPELAPDKGLKPWDFVMEIHNYLKKN